MLPTSPPSTEFVPLPIAPPPEEFVPLPIVPPPSPLLVPEPRNPPSANADPATNNTDKTASHIARFMRASCLRDAFDNTSASAAERSRSNELGRTGRMAVRTSGFERSGDVHHTSS